MRPRRPDRRREDLIAALDSGKVAAAAIDVFPVEPARESPFFGRDNVICTPHLGAATLEAQENVALQVAEQMAGLSADWRRDQRAQHAVAHGRGGDAAAALM
ncbi:MAG: NAD(P)-dependent oxidoreductase [Aliidongia sp.]